MDDRCQSAVRKALPAQELQLADPEVRPVVGLTATQRVPTALLLEDFSLQFALTDLLMMASQREQLSVGLWGQL